MATIILVDDEQDILDPLQEMLESENFRVRSFLEPQQALAFLKGDTADLAVGVCLPSSAALSERVPVQETGAAWCLGATMSGHS